MPKSKQPVEDTEQSKVIVSTARRKFTAPIQKLAGATVVVVLIVAGVWLVLGRAHTTQKTPSTVSSQIKDTPQPSVAQLKQQIAKNANATTPSAKQALVSDYSSLGAQYSKAGQTQDAVTAYTKVMQLDPSAQIEAYSGLAYTYLEAGDKQNAIIYFNKLIDLSKNSQDAVQYANIQIYQNEINYLGAGQ